LLPEFLDDYAAEDNPVRALEEHELVVWQAMGVVIETQADWLDMFWPLRRCGCDNRLRACCHRAFCPYPRERGVIPISEPTWKTANRAHWDEKVALHLSPRGYDLTDLRAGRGRFNAIEEAEIWPVDRKRVLHLQCHFRADTLKLAQRGATVVGLDFSPPAIIAAGQLADELGLAGRARFIQADLYDAPTAILEPAAFDRPCQTKSGPMHHGMRLARQVGIPSEDQAMTVHHSASAAERLCL
jgi:hypothetical protein